MGYSENLDDINAAKRAAQKRKGGCRKAAFTLGYVGAVTAVLAYMALRMLVAGAYR